MPASRRGAHNAGRHNLDVELARKTDSFEVRSRVMGALLGIRRPTIRRSVGGPELFEVGTRGQIAQRIARAARPHAREIYLGVPRNLERIVES